MDESARERLERQLASAPDDVVAIAAPSSPLAPGASYRVHAEWTALDTPDALAPASDPVRGAVLVRPGVAYAVRDGRVEIGSGTVLVDPGAHTHDPHDPIGPLAVGSERGRPPFPRRPVVVRSKATADALMLRPLVPLSSQSSTADPTQGSTATMIGAT